MALITIKTLNWNKIEGEARLAPVGANQYDLSSIDLTAKNAEVALLNGENTHVYMKNATYHLT